MLAVGGIRRTGQQQATAATATPAGIGGKSPVNIVFWAVMAPEFGPGVPERKANIMQRPSVPRLFCFGLGFSPLAFIDLVGPEGWRIAGTTRRPEKLRGIAGAGDRNLPVDRGRPLDDAATALAGTTHLLTAVPPMRTATRCSTITPATSQRRCRAFSGSTIFR